MIEKRDTGKLPHDSLMNLTSKEISNCLVNFKPLTVSTFVNNFMCLCSF